MTNAADRPLTKKQELFVKFYTGNGEEAALKAGYSKRSASVIASQNLNKLNVNLALKAKNDRKEEQLRAKILTTNELRAWWSEILLSSEVELPHRIKCSELLGRSQAAFVDRVEGKVEHKVLQVLTNKPVTGLLSGKSKQTVIEIEGKEVGQEEKNKV